MARTNVWESIGNMLRDGRTIREAVRQGGFQVVGTVYNLNNARVDWIGVHT